MRRCDMCGHETSTWYAVEQQRDEILEMMQGNVAHSMVKTVRSANLCGPLCAVRWIVKDAT